MTFAEKLNTYMREYNCTPRRLVALSGVSGATISRYRAGTREPAADSVILENLAAGLFRAAEESDRASLSAEQIKHALQLVLHDAGGIYDTNSLRVNLDMLIQKLHLNTRELAAFIGLDPSKLFRIRWGQSRPANIGAFCTGIGSYVFSKLGDDAAIDSLSDILGCTPSELNSEESVIRRITGLLMGNAYSPRAYAESFLRALDKFDIDDYVSALDGSSCCFSCDAEKAFIAALENTPPDSTAIICTDLYSDGTEENRMMNSLEYIIAALVSKGVTIKLVLNADNPMDEILPGLRTLMPVFMSGKVSAYYLKGRRDGIYRYRLISLDHAALCSEAVTGHYDTAMTRVALTGQQASLYRQRAEQILEFASPLIEIIDSNEKRMALVASGAAIPGKRVGVLSTPPFYTMNSALIDRIMERNGICGETADRIKQYLHAERSRVKRITRSSEYVCCFPDIPRESYDEKPVFLSLSGLFYDREILCTYDEYAEHVRLTQKFEKQYTNFRCIPEKNSPFRNIQIFMHTGHGVMLSKNKTPAIHLFINHSKLRQAFENILSLYGESI